MAFNDISLTAGMRNNLVSLQDTVSLLNRTQVRLSSGKKVNSALDNPTSFFAAQALNSRAADLSALKDNMGQAIQTVTAANNGISGITTLVEAAKGIAQSALSTSDTTSRASFAAQFDGIVAQINTLAQDSGYKGTNLLNNNNLTVNFNETGSSSLTISGTAANAGLTFTAAAAAWTTTDNTAINTAVTELGTATTSLRNTASSLSANLAIVNARQDFTTQMVNTLTAGADKLTLADMNEEGANMLMLQTRQALGTTALSLSAQAAQSVLKLF
ncbi:MAG: flagellin [Nitrospirae bacterium]|nr:flagellin [Nitrospirota bacterium]NTW65163.1 flagellin [Nitrospirota bacterium]